MPADRRHQVFVVELGDGLGPRRRRDRPNLFVGITTQDPAEHYERIKASSSKRHRTIREHGVRLRSDLTRNYGPTTETEAKRQKRKVSNKLMRRGFTVNGDTRIWRLYVIELDDGVGPREHPTFPWVYVGESTLSPEQRFEQHRKRARNNKGPLFSRVVADHGRRLRPDLYEHEPPLYTREEAKIAEAVLGDRLARAGYSIKGAH
jgi:hypothetical protein